VLDHDGTKLEASATGDGMVEAACNAIRQATGMGSEGRLTDYAVTSVTGGVDALADVALRFEVDGHSMPGRGLSTDVVEASARAFLNAINRVTRLRDSGEDPDRGNRPGSLRGV
jgi:2-isopropylmalate synthase